MFVTKNINKRLNIILEAWEVSTIMRNLSQWITSFSDYLHKDLENDVSNVLLWKVIMSSVMPKEFLILCKRVTHFHHGVKHSC